MILKIKFFAILFGLFSCLSTQALADPVITIVRGQEFPPYHYLDTDQKETGFVVEIIRQTAAMSNFQIQFKQFPWSRCLSLVESGQADAMMNLFKTKEREGFLYFDHNIIAHETNSFFTRTASRIRYNGDLSSIAPYRLGTIRNYSYGAGFDQFNFPAKFSLETEMELLKSLARSRVDVIIANQLTLKVLIRQSNLNDDIRQLSPDLSKEPLYIGFSKAAGHKELSGRFSINLNRFKQTQAYQDILNRYLAASP